jgi:N-acetylglucosamine kinase-like BadF-type ATPase
MDDPRAIINALGAGKLSREKIAALAPDVLAAADAGDVAARDVVRRAAVELADMAAAVWRVLELDKDAGARLAGTGSLLEKSVVFRRACAAALTEALPGVALLEPHLPSVAGAVLLALQVAGVAAEGPVMARLELAAGS